MDDEEEDMSRPISQHWGTPFGDVKYEDRPTRIAAGQAAAGITAALPTSQSHNNNVGSVSALPCSVLRQPHVPFHGEDGVHVRGACLHVRSLQVPDGELCTNSRVSRTFWRFD